MNEQRTYILERLAELLHVEIYSERDDALESCQNNSIQNPITSDEQLRNRLREGADKQDLPLLYTEEDSVYYICVRSEGTYYYAGPVSLGELSKVELHRYYQRHGIRSAEERPLRRLQFSELVDMAQLMEAILNDRQIEDVELARANHMTAGDDETEAQEAIRREIQSNEEDAYHHTYQEERRLLDCVREGRTEDALHLTRTMDADLGIMSDRAINQWRYTAIVGITLCTRAAIEGGISPAQGYRISDFYINKCDTCQDVAQMIRYRNTAIERLSAEVDRRRQQRHTSSYVEQSKDYIRRHYREKIYLQDIADSLGISEGYLSRLFRAETGTTLQDYITQVRVERAANLLMYSDESIARIATYVNFPSQSYFGRVFMKYKNVSPKKYRELHKPREF